MNFDPDLSSLPPWRAALQDAAPSRLLKAQFVKGRMWALRILNR